MSFATQSPRARRVGHRQSDTRGRDLDIRRCEQCSGHYPHSGEHRYGFNRRFCRRQCKYRSIADARLDDIRADHKYCASCYRKLKTVDPPLLTKKSAERGKAIPRCATGRQDYAEYAIHDQRNTAPPRDTDADDDREYPSTDLRPRMTCECPANHHKTVRDFSGPATLSKAEAIEHTKRLVDALEALDDAGVHSTAFDADVLFWFVREAKSRSDMQGGDDREHLRNGLSLAIQEAAGR